MSTTTTLPPAQGWLSRIGGRLGRQAAAPALPQAAIEERRNPPAVPPLAILAGALRTPHGASAGELNAALAANKVDADLDRTLVDDDGLPVMSVRCGQAIDEPVREEIADWLTAHAAPVPHLSDEQWRALVLGTAVLRELAGHAAATLLQHDGGAPALQLAPVLPDDWLPEQRQAASMWWQQVLVQSGWPAAQAAVVTPESPPAFIARFAHEAVTSTTPVATILLACASHIGQETVDRWAAAGTLFTSVHPRGRIPGEGAAGLLLAPVAGDAGRVNLSLDIEARDPSLANQKRLSHDQLNTLAERLLQGAAVAPADIAMIVADTGPDTRQVLELMEFASASAPHLDNASDIVRLGPACGACGAVPFVAALAVAAHAALEHGAPLLCVSNDNPALRALALVHPFPPSQDGS
ncbi:hypothetical protein [Massilia sp. HP4]|uniref:hypothetical protein n=1 Tax=Massilia sp. HP4 TaxID=2562316 RepID=UPI0010C00244|nr:hypothetical protein [Massilia sp. HP4]